MPAPTSLAPEPNAPSEPAAAPAARTDPNDVWTYVDGAWAQGDVRLFGAMTHALWLGSMVFDGARVVDGMAPDLDKHCARTVASAEALGLESPVTAGEIEEIALDGAARFPRDAALYVRPIVWAEAGGRFMIAPDPTSSRFALTLWRAPMPADPMAGFSVTSTRFRRPTLESMPVNAKAGCLYPNNARMMREAREKGADNAVVCDALGNVAELATANLFIVRNGVVSTPAPNGTFLNGVTRQRVIHLLRKDGFEVREEVLSLDDVRAADEAFSTGNLMKVSPITRFDRREYPSRTVAERAQRLYWDWASTAK